MSNTQIRIRENPFPYLFGLILLGYLVKRRADLVIFMDILGNLLDGPARPTRLAGACNLNYDNLMKFANVLLARGLIQVSEEEGHEQYSISQAGLEMHRQYRKFWEALYPI